MFKTLLLCSCVVVLLCGCEDDPRCFPVSNDGTIKTCVDKTSIDKKQKSIVMITENLNDSTKMTAKVEVDCGKNRMRPVDISIYSPSVGKHNADSNLLREQREWIYGSYGSNASIVIQHYCSSK